MYSWKRIWMLVLLISLLSLSVFGAEIDLESEVYPAMSSVRVNGVEVPTYVVQGNFFVDVDEIEAFTGRSASGPLNPEDTMFIKEDFELSSEESLGNLERSNFRSHLQDEEGVFDDESSVAIYYFKRKDGSETEELVMLNDLLKYDDSLVIE